MLKETPTILLLAILFCQCTPEETTSINPVAEIDSLLSTCYNNGTFNGTVLLAKGDSVLYRKAFGYADFRSKEELTPESSFYLASVSKQFTTMSIMLLEDRGIISYDDKLSQFFPNFPPYADLVTIRHLMTHTSGIPDQYRLGAYKPGLTNEDVLELLLQQELEFEPGSQYMYSNGAYVLLSMIVEVVAAQPYAQFMNDNIFQPLQMENTLVYDTTAPQVINRAIGFNSGELDDYVIFTTGAGGMFSNIDDLHKWYNALNKDQLLDFESMSEAYAPQILNSGDTSYYGFGWMLSADPNVVRHTGSMNGYRTFVQRLLDKDLVIVYLTNNGDALNEELNNLIHDVLTKNHMVR